MATDEFPCESVDNDYRGLLAAYQMDHMEYPPDPDNDTTRTVYFDEDGEMHEMENEETCMHGMSAWLCMGPMHYPSREQEMRGEYF